MIIKKFLNKIHISYYTLFLILISLIAGLFKELIVISSLLLIHEFGHFILMNKYNWNIIKIDIYPFGGIVKLNEKIDTDLKEELIITICGPLFQIILFFLIYIINKYMYIDDYIYNLYKNYNFTILFFNLLPIIPLDGSKILNVLLNKLFNFRVSYIINIVLSVLFLSVFALIFKSDTSYYIIIIFLIYQIHFYYRNRFIIFNRFILEKKLERSKYIKYKKIDSIKKMYRNKKNFIKKNGTYISEYKYK